MSSLYKNGDTYYIAVSFEGERVTRSLATKHYHIARKLKPHMELKLLKELHHIDEKPVEMPFKELVRIYLKTDHNWAPNTINLKQYVLNNYLAGKSLPINSSSKAIHIRTINSCWNWGLKKGYVTKAFKLDGITKSEARTRVFSKKELKLMFDHINDQKFNSFVRLAYYTGARSGEIRNLYETQLTDNAIEVYGKTGKRLIKLNKQAAKIIKRVYPLWNYKKDYVSHKFKKEIRRLGIKNGRFHDLRRTFGLNHIKQGMSIYKVSKLLGHKSVRTTEQHYAPLLVTEIGDFKL